MIECDMLEAPLTATLEDASLEVRPAPAELRHLLGCFWVLRGAGTPIRTFPDGCAQVVVEHGRAFLAGPKLGTEIASPQTGLMGVRLRPGAAYLLLDSPVCAIAGRRVRLKAPRLATLDRLVSFLGERLRDRRVDERVDRAVQRIERSAGDDTVEEIAKACGVGRRQLERLMGTWVGLTPKRLCRIARFQSALAEMRDRRPNEWIRLAASGYADQPHLIREFQEFAGGSPKRMMQTRGPAAREARCG